MKIPDESRAWAEEAVQRLTNAASTMEGVAGNLVEIDANSADDLFTAATLTRDVLYRIRDSLKP